MQICDFQRSFLTFRIDATKQEAITHSHKAALTLNNARIALECRCIISADGEDTEYVLGASCKTERCYVSEDIWTDPNADFCPVVSNQDMLLIKRWDKTDKGVMLHPPSLGPQPERQVDAVARAWDRLDVRVEMTEGQPLSSVSDIIEATFEGRPLICQTRLTTPDGRDVLLEYPIKTINVNERDTVYQVDTGPLLFVDPVPDSEPDIAGLRLAYVAHNAPDWAEFLINVPTPLTEDLSVHHYSRVERIDGVTNTMIAMA